MCSGKQVIRMYNMSLHVNPPSPWRRGRDDTPSPWHSGDIIAKCTLYVLVTIYCTVYIVHAIVTIYCTFYMEVTIYYIVHGSYNLLPIVLYMVVTIYCTLYMLVKIYYPWNAWFAPCSSRYSVLLQLPPVRRATRCVSDTMAAASPLSRVWQLSLAVLTQGTHQWEGHKCIGGH